VACGGGWNHRLGLFDRVMLKDNHLALLGLAPRARGFSTLASRVLSSNSQLTEGSELKTRNSATREAAALAAVVAAARRRAPGLPVEIEVDHPRQVPAVLSAGVDVILLDNFHVPQLRRAVARISGRAFTEASGGITLKNIPRLAPLGLDFVSTGALVHHSVWVDIGLDWRP
jgi:nicotinate-nucleotide pyrophosphorylase (carboxylating)